MNEPTAPMDVVSSPESGTQTPTIPATGQVPEATNTNGNTAYSEDYVKDLRKESANYRTRANEALSQLEAERAEKAKLTERIDALESATKVNNTKSALAKAAEEYGACYADVIYLLTKDSELNTDAEGHPDGEALKTVLEALKTSKPALFSRQTTGITIDAGNKGNSAPTNEELGNMPIGQFMELERNKLQTK